MTEPVDNNNQQSQNPQTTPAPAPANGGDGQQVDPKWLNERLDRAKNSAINELLKALGFEKQDDLKGLVDKARQDEAAKLSEVEKATKALDKEREARSAAEKAVVELKAERLRDKQQSALKDAAREAKAKDPNDILMWAKEYAAADLSGLVNEDGTIEEKAVKALIAKAQAAKPDWFGAVAGPGSPSNRTGKPADPKAQVEALKGKRLFGL